MEKEKFTRIESYEDLKNKLRGDEHGTQTHELFIQLTIGRSWKQMSLAEEGGSKKEDIFYVTNEIDDTEQRLTGEQLYDKGKSNIGEALEKGALYYGWC